MESHQKGSLKLKCFSRLKILTSPFILQKPLFKWHDMEWHGHGYEYIGGGCIFRNGVMHANIAKP
jgi:hypothetical protein